MHPFPVPSSFPIPHVQPTTSTSTSILLCNCSLEFHWLFPCQPRCAPTSSLRAMTAVSPLVVPWKWTMDLKHMLLLVIPVLSNQEVNIKKTHSLLENRKQMKEAHCLSNDSGLAYPTGGFSLDTVCICNSEKYVVVGIPSAVLRQSLNVCLCCVISCLP